MYRSLRLSGFFICEQNQTEGLHDRMIGRILRAMSGFYWVETAEGVLECRLRGRLKRIEQQSEIAVIGDLVEVVVVSPGQGAIEAVHERTTRLSRVAVGSRGHKEDLIVANVDLVIVVVALANPEFHPRMLDRYLMICAHNDLEARIVASKADLVSAEYAAQAMAPYAQIGYETQTISTQTGEGLDVVKHWLPGRISVVTGKSGVGKSSLLNAINPDLALSVGAVSTTLNKGRHTTTMAQLIPLGNGGYVADTPASAKSRYGTFRRTNSSMDSVNSNHISVNADSAIASTRMNLTVQYVQQWDRAPFRRYAMTAISAC